MTAILSDESQWIERGAASLVDPGASALLLVNIPTSTA
jgi:hypothetical protein